MYGYRRIPFATANSTKAERKEYVSIFCGFCLAEWTVSILRCRLTNIGIPIIKIRRSHDRLIFIMRSRWLERRSLYCDGTQPSIMVQSMLLMVWTDVTSLRLTWPYHLSQRVRSTFSRSSSCILPGRSCELTCSFVGHIAHPANHSPVMVLRAMQIRGWGPGFDCTEHGTPDARIVNSSSGGEAE